MRPAGLAAVAQAGGNPVDGQVYRALDPLVGIPRTMMLEQSYLQMVQRVDIRCTITP